MNKLLKMEKNTFGFTIGLRRFHIKEGTWKPSLNQYQQEIDFNDHFAAAGMQKLPRPLAPCNTSHISRAWGYLILNTIEKDSGITPTVIQTQPPEVFYGKSCFLKIPQNSQENTYVRVSFLIKLQAWGLHNGPLSLFHIETTAFICGANGRDLLHERVKSNVLRKIVLRIIM